jgi:hypothetical protein
VFTNTQPNSLKIHRFSYPHTMLTKRWMSVAGRMCVRMSVQGGWRLWALPRLAICTHSNSRHTNQTYVETDTHTYKHTRTDIHTAWKQIVATELDVVLFQGGSSYEFNSSALPRAKDPSNGFTQLRKRLTNSDHKHTKNKNMDTSVCWKACKATVSQPVLRMRKGNL